MAEKLKGRYNTLKSKTAVAKGNVTKALKKLEQVIASYEKHNRTETHITTIKRIAAEVCESVELARVKMKTLSQLGDEFIDTITELDDSMFENPDKATIISTIEIEVEKFEQSFKDIIEQKEGAVLDAEGLASGPPVLQTPSSSRTGNSRRHMEFIQTPGKLEATISGEKLQSPRNSTLLCFV